MLNDGARQLKWWLMIKCLKPFEWGNSEKWQVTLIASSVGISYELIQKLTVWNRNATCVCLTIIGCTYK